MKSCFFAVSLGVGFGFGFSPLFSFAFFNSIIQENEAAKPDAEDRTLKAQISNEDMEASFREDSVDVRPHFCIMKF